MPVPGAGEGSLGLVEPREDLLGLLDEDLAQGREPGAAAVAFDEAHPQVAFQRRQVMRDRRHPVTQRLRGPRQRPPVADRDEHTQLLRLKH